MTTHGHASIQHGIAKFMHGGSYGSQMMINPFEEAMRRPLADSVKDIEEYCAVRSHVFLNEVKQQMQEVGGLPDQCLSCAAFHCDQSHERDPLRNDENFRVCMTCKAQGCDSAREQYVKNFQELSRTGRAAISIDVNLDATPIEEDHYGMFGERHTVLSRHADNRIQIIPSMSSLTIKPGTVSIKGGKEFGELRDHFDSNEFISYGEFQSYAKETPIRKQEQEIAEFVEMELNNDLSRYGVETW